MDSQKQEENQANLEDKVMVLDGKLAQALTAVLDLALKAGGLQASGAVNAVQQGIALIDKAELAKALDKGDKPAKKSSKKKSSKKAGAKTK